MSARIFVFVLIAAAGFTAAGAGIWCDGLRDERAVARTLAPLPRPNDTPFFRCADSFYWVSYAEDMITRGTFRARFTAMDNAPYGRANSGWASLNCWYLIALAKTWALATGASIQHALLPAALWSNPILYAVALAGILIFGLKNGNFPAAAAAIFVFGGTPRVHDDFAYALPGHHGWHDLACFALLVSLAAGIRKKNARRWFAAAGVAGAVAIWIGATQQAFGIAAAGIGALLGLIVRRGDEEQDFPPAEAWRVFGLTSGIVALFLYLLEYAPGPFAMRLEVNHPLYAIAFSLGGEFLCRAQRLLDTSTARSRNDWLFALACAAVLAVIAGAILFGPAEWHAMRQPFMQRFHHEIAEFQPMQRWYGASSWLIAGAPLSLVAIAFWRAFDSRLTMRQRTALLVCACPCLLAVALSFLQLRWLGIAGATAAALAAVLCADFKLRASEAKICEPAHFRYSLGFCFSLGLVACWLARHAAETPGEIRAQAIDRVATMDVAGVLRTQSNRARPIALFSNQKERQAWVDLAAGVRSVGSLYWDNPAGARDEAEFLASDDEAAAHRIAMRRGINFVVVRQNAASVVIYNYLWRGDRNAPQMRRTLAYRLAAPQPTPPAWLQLLPISTPAMSLEKIRIYRVL
ncbi:MAG TPA: hypothetical protein VGG02_04390 [Chthoniobacterales bacterium]